MINTIEAKPARRSDYHSLEEGQKNIKFADLIIDGRSLYQRLMKHDMVPSLGWMSTECQREMIDYFLLRKPHDTMGCRYPLMVCSWCGDEECGFISVRIDKVNDIVSWSDFRLEHGMTKINIGPFHFEWDRYEKVINSTFGVAGIQ
ncbi:oxidoreductase [Paenibacillus sp. FSL K6-1096]|uniref:oxidoreductase n=1 Tax=Paenibacillus sp. FSL K6-1096 TaxID=2921460 RepID=UPI0030ED47A9